MIDTPREGAEPGASSGAYSARRKARSARGCIGDGAVPGRSQGPLSDRPDHSRLGRRLPPLARICCVGCLQYPTISSRGEREALMTWQTKSCALAAVFAGFLSIPAEAQFAGKYLTPQNN